MLEKNVTIVAMSLRKLVGDIESLRCRRNPNPNPYHIALICYRTINQGRTAYLMVSFGSPRLLIYPWWSVFHIGLCW